MAAHLVNSKVNNESLLSYNTFENKDETGDDHPAASKAEDMNSRFKCCWRCWLLCCCDRQSCKICGYGSDETVSDDIEFALGKYIQVYKKYEIFCITFRI